MFKFIRALNLIDFYKVGHVRHYPENTVTIVVNWTARKTRRLGLKYSVFFGLQYFIKEYIIELWNETFFSRPLEEVVAHYKRRIGTSLGIEDGKVFIEHIKKLHAVGYLPIEIKALPEGTFVPFGVPVLTIKNTMPEFYWIPNYIETCLSNIDWKPSTSATTAMMFKKTFNKYADETVGNRDFVPFQGHDFSYRGMGGTEDAFLSGAGHLLFFYGTDTVPAIDMLEAIYNADCTKEIVGVSVTATEHSVMSMGQREKEFETFERLIFTTDPTGFISIVSDTWNLWDVVKPAPGGYLFRLKDRILNRNGKVVIRPDSGIPEYIICGYRVFEWKQPNVRPTLTDLKVAIARGFEVIKIEDKYFRIEENGVVTMTKELNEWEVKGVVECLWDIFGGTITSKGYKLLSEKIGCIYGDGITLARQEAILSRLKEKGFCSFNVVLGIGSYTYVNVTRDVLGFAMKATYGELIDALGNIEQREIFKDPVTDDGFKKSARGLVGVFRNADGELYLKDQLNWEEEIKSLLRTVFINGKFIRETSLSEVRALVEKELEKYSMNELMFV